MGIIYRVNNQNYEIYTTEHKPTPQEIGAALSSHNHTFDSITGKPSSYTPTSHTHTKSQINDFPTSMTPTAHNHTFDSITGKPSTYPPNSHTHTAAQIGALPLSGGTMTGNISVKTTNYTSIPIKITDSGNTYGHLLRIQGGGDVVIGSGESPDSLINNLKITGQTENLHLTSDEYIYIYTNCNAIANRKIITIDKSGKIIAPGGFSGYIVAGQTVGTAIGQYATAEGDKNKATGPCSHAEGLQSTASGESSHAEGFEAKASGYRSHAEGANCTASGMYSHAEGNMSTASGESSHAEGYYTKTIGSYSHATGLYTIANAYQHVSGRYNVDTAGPPAINTTPGSLVVVGMGLAENSRTNAFRVAANGTVYGRAAFQSSGADYAEYFEWKDQNPNKEDRCGLFVTLDGNKIRIANSNNQYVLGVISNIYSACCVGNSYFGDNWHGMYLTDVFNKPLKEKKMIKISKNTRLELSIENNNLNDEYEEIEIEAPILNPEWNKDQQYISREDRPEWDLVGLLGQLTVIDDGTCIENQYCRVSDNGIATLSDTNNGYYVMKRLDDNHIKILFR